ncbi:MAG TPA: DEAD/DEAH box helicase, partial [Ferruginibacter sp.]|nr:DEAD/DEAH box helicase [Ferruginibacter sp.]
MPTVKATVRSKSSSVKSSSVKKSARSNGSASHLVNDDLEAQLQQHFGFDQFKGQQKEIIRTLLSGQDTFVIMPTGGGKSLCYQLPAMMLDGVAIIVSPLIALMKN